MAIWVVAKRICTLSLKLMECMNRNTSKKSHLLSQRLVNNQQITPQEYMTVLLFGSLGRFVNSLDFSRHRLSPLAVFSSPSYHLHNGRWWQWIPEVYSANLKTFLKACNQTVPGNNQEVVAYATGCKNMFFHTLSIFWSARKWCNATTFPSSITFPL